MSDLANNIQGEHFALPATAAYWRVRRLKEGRGAPEVVFGPDGGPLLVAVEIDFEAFRTAVEHLPGRYRLDALDETRRPIEGIPAAYVAVPVLSRSARLQADPTDDRAALATPAPPTPPTVSSAAVPPHDALLAEVIRGQNQLVALMTERFSGFMVSAADLVRAIPHHVLTTMMTAPPSPLPQPPTSPAPEDLGGPRNAGSREPWPLEADRSDDGEAQAGEHGDGSQASGMAATMTAVNNIVGEVMPVVKLFMAHRMAKGGPSPRNAASPPADCATAPVGPIADNEPGCGPLSLAELRHLDAIDAALTPGEAQRHQLVTDDLTSRDRRNWFDTLCSLDVEDAVAMIRRHIARAQRMHGGVPPVAPRRPDASPSGETHPLQEDNDDPCPKAIGLPADLFTPPVGDTTHPVADAYDLASGRAERACAACGSPSTPCACGAPSPRVVTPAMVAHALSVQAALTPTESTQVFALAAEMPDDEREAWMAELSTVTVDDAVKAVREALAGLDGPIPYAPLGPFRRGDEPDPTSAFLYAPETTSPAASPSSMPAVSLASPGLAAPTAPEPHDR